MLKPGIPLHLDFDSAKKPSIRSTKTKSAKPAEKEKEPSTTDPDDEPDPDDALLKRVKVACAVPGFRKALIEWMDDSGL